MPNKSMIQSCSAQRSVMEALLKGLQIGSIFRVWGGVGRGNSTVLKEAHKQIGGAFLGMKEFVDASSHKHPMALEATLDNLVRVAESESSESGLAPGDVQGQSHALKKNQIE